MNTYWKFGAIVAVIIGVLAWLAMGGVTESKTYYKEIKEVTQMGDRAQGEKLRVNGYVEQGSIVRNGAAVSFVLHQTPGVLRQDPVPAGSGVYGNRSAARYVQGQCTGSGRWKVRTGRRFSCQQSAGEMRVQVRSQATNEDGREASNRQTSPQANLLALPSTEARRPRCRGLKSSNGKYRRSLDPARLLFRRLRCHRVGGTGKLKKNSFLIVSAQRAVYSVWVLLTVAAGLLIYSLLTGDFRLAYVAAHTDSSMSTIYKFTAWWGGQEGSLLLWSWLLATYSAVVVFMNRRKFRDMMPWVTSVLMTTETFFLMLIASSLSPFEVLEAGRGNVVEGVGQGLNPLLQYWTMVIHPPMLYLGYVGFTVPFAFAIGSLITKQPGDAWIHTTRRWTLVTWLFQTTGILLGQGWAYAVLGWGGYWAWDPVENASLLPWITATAFLHSVMMQEKKGMMKVWNMVLISGTFFLCIFGTFLTRSGVVSSVHAFAQSPIGKYFVMFLAVGIAATVFLILERLKYLKSEAQLESVLSRESSFMFNNLILLASCFAVLWGTLFPVISEAVTGEKISVDAPFFNRINIPIGLALMFADRRRSADRLAPQLARKLEARVLVADHRGRGPDGRCWPFWASMSIPTRWCRSACACS